MCQRMLKEREQQIREDYDKVLASKLAGTYVHAQGIELPHSRIGGIESKQFYLSVVS